MVLKNLIGVRKILIKLLYVFSGIEIGNGTIKINIPSFDKQLVFDYNDIESFKQNLLN